MNRDNLLDFMVAVRERTVDVDEATDTILELITKANTSEKANELIPDVVCSLESKSKTIGLTLDKKYKVLAEHKDVYKNIDEIVIINDFGDFGIYTREHFV